MLPFLIFPQGMNREIIKNVVELLQSSMKKLALLVAALYTVGFFSAVASNPRMFGWNLVPGLLVLVITCSLTYLLVEKLFLTAQVIFQAGLSAAIILAATAFQVPEILFLLALQPMIAASVLGWAGGLAVQIWISACILLLPAAVEIGGLLPAHQWGVAACGLLSGFLGWLATYTLITVMEWLAYSYQKAQENLEEARSQRAQLVRAWKDMDRANYQLERANASLVAARRMAEEAERFKAEFVANVSHELRTPLNLIIGFSEVMITSPESYGGERLPGPYRSDVNAIYNSARHLLALVDDVLDLGRLDASRVALVCEEVTVQALINEVREMMGDYITAKGLNFNLEIEENLPALLIDRLRIRQVLLNLLVNAARFTEQGSISLKAMRQNAELVFQVKDTGKGIPEQELPHIFDPFHTTGTGSDGKWHSGTGLGLPISKKFVELHHGRMGVESEPGKGTLFWFALPCKPAIVSTYRGPALADVLAKGLKSTEAIVVVVSEDPGLTTVLQRHIEGCRFLSVQSIQQAAQLSREVQAAAIITAQDSDLLIEDVSIPMVHLPWPTRRQVASALGAADFLIKPVSGQQLAAAIDRLHITVNKILIADDDPEMVRLIRRMVRSRFPAQNCLEAYNGQEALERIAADRPDLILLDLNMPGSDGHQVLESLTRSPDGAGIPVIVISGKDWKDLDIPLNRPIQLYRPNGFQLSETLALLEPALSAFSSSWGALASREPAPEEAPVD